MAGLNTVWTRNPAGLSASLYTNTRVERAANVAGAPGAFVEIANIAIDTSDEFTAYIDTGGAADSWYRYRWANLAGTSFSDYPESPAQPGTNAVKTNIKRNVPDADILDPLWDQWIASALIELFAYGIWKIDYADVVITSSGGVAAERYGLAAKIRDIIRVERLSTSSGNPVLYELSPGEFRQEQRQIYIPGGTVGDTYRVWGRAPFTAVGEMTDDWFPMLEEMIRVRYLQFRENGRGNYRAYIVLDRASDITPEQLRTMRLDAEARVQRMAAPLSFGEPAIPAPSGGY